MFVQETDVLYNILETKMFLVNWIKRKEGEEKVGTLRSTICGYHQDFGDAVNSMVAGSQVRSVSMGGERNLSFRTLAKDDEEENWELVGEEESITLRNGDVFNLVPELKG